MRREISVVEGGEMVSGGEVGYWVHNDQKRASVCLFSVVVKWQGAGSTTTKNKHTDARFRWWWVWKVVALEDNQHEHGGAGRLPQPSKTSISAHLRGRRKVDAGSVTFCFVTACLWTRDFTSHMFLCHLCYELLS